jgi:hypothetical protein
MHLTGVFRASGLLAQPTPSAYVAEFGALALDRNHTPSSTWDM